MLVLPLFLPLSHPNAIAPVRPHCRSPLVVAAPPRSTAGHAAATSGFSGLRATHFGRRLRLRATPSPATTPRQSFSSAPLSALSLELRSVAENRFQLQN